MIAMIAMVIVIVTIVIGIKLLGLGAILGSGDSEIIQRFQFAILFGGYYFSLAYIEYRSIKNQEKPKKKRRVTTKK